MKKDGFSFGRSNYQEVSEPGLGTLSALEEWFQVMQALSELEFFINCHFSK
jgi:hypothetical protein